MVSPLRYEISPSTMPASPTIQSTSWSPPQKKQKMSLTQTYYVAHTARSKLSKEAAKGDHNLRLLVGHANLLDGLMLDLANAEQEQESWFNQTVKSAAQSTEEPKHIQWADTLPAVVEEAVEEEFYAESSDDESDSDEEDMEITQPIAVPRPRSPVTTLAVDLDEDEEMVDDDYEEELTLTRTSSRHPPELEHDESDSESDDDSMPPSPPQTEIPLDAYSEKQRQAIATTGFFPSITVKSDLPTPLPDAEQASFFDEGFYLPPRQTTIAAY